MADIDFLNSGNQLFQTATQYEDVYNALANSLGLHNQDIFMIAVYLGVRSGKKKSARNYQGKEFRPSYLSKKQQGVLYGLAFRDRLFKKEADFKDPELINDAKLLFNEYANQGAMIIRDTVLNGFDISQVGKKEQSEVARSIVQYLLKEKDATPF